VTRSGYSLSYARERVARSDQRIVRLERRLDRGSRSSSQPPFSLDYPLEHTAARASGSEARPVNSVRAKVAHGTIDQLLRFAVSGG
jgi:hypothetical protein